MDNQLFNNLLKMQGQLAIEYNSRKKQRKYEKQKAEKERWKRAQNKNVVL